MHEENISINALKVVNRLTEHGYQAYLVGGCIRDLILGKVPKDFDVATDAHPEDIRDLFRNSRIVGKRFKIVHVRFGREIVEVTTFRAPHDEQYEDNHSESGMTLVDNIYGTFEEDVFRRDFAMNAVYYQPEAHEITDLAGGVEDIQLKRIRTIGDPEARFREDPVRMLRAIRFEAKLEFHISDELHNTIRSLGHLIQDVSAARLFEEVLKLFMSGHGAAALDSMVNHELYGWMFPDSKRSMEEHPAEELVRLALTSTDSRIAEGKPVTPAFIYAAMLWFPFVDERDQLQKEGRISHVAASHEAANNILSKQQLFTSIPRRFSGTIRDIWFLQFRLPNRATKKPDTLMEHKRFRAAYDFLLIREAAGEETGNLGDWWTEYQEAAPERRPEMKQSTGKRRKRKRKRKPRSPNAMIDTPTPT
ncbi:MAG: polynucleotide adenylyltransferase PcnB [Gammaproteobacteria bacterium]|nr:polynucleotide adenylyltransferase PcnB [Gammaproteobacteria bacterium]MBT4492857.1 polynucleotide adenylyltransferase PcnB [Gammaproteobacteria bacterium]MBT7370052.1 polynucleotide adenylyltransferase PcnB [Gammaproteobacteria bacterium]